jgi:endonuclease/exonuclease/phosphatase family metal-dependent hydrolase
MSDVRVGTFNVENLFARFKFREGIRPEDAVEDGWNALQLAFDLMSPESKAITGSAIERADADVLCLQEVETLDTLRRFRSKFLGGPRRYPYALVIDGNDRNRLIDVAILSKHRIVHARSYAHVRDDVGEVFSRDCLEADVEVTGKRLTVFVQHFKSMVGGRAATHAKRLRQVQATMEIVEDRFGPNAGEHPFVVLGDFNDYMETDAQGKPAIGDLVEWDQVENVVARLPSDERWTHYYDGRGEYKQLDYLLPSQTLAQASAGAPEIVRVGLPTRADRYTGERIDGVGFREPKASDHCPVVMTIQL